MTDTQTALEAVERLRKRSAYIDVAHSQWEMDFSAIRAALTAPAEPVAWSLVFNERCGVNALTTFKTKSKADAYAEMCAMDGGDGPKIVPLFTSSPSDAARIAELEAEKQELLEALEPFAAAAEGFVEAIKGTLIAFTQDDGEQRFEYSLVPADFANAAALHAKLKGDA